MFVDCLNLQTLKREKPKPVTGRQQTEEIVLTKGTKGEKYKSTLHYKTCKFLNVILCCASSALNSKYNPLQKIVHPKINTVSPIRYSTAQDGRLELL